MRAAPHRAFKCSVVLQLHAITCPGVLLPSREEIYLGVRIMGQYHKSKCVPAAFPLLLHEKLVFTKIFREAVDPGDVADRLENDTTFFELIQLVPPEGEILATLEENTRGFLYPGTRLTLQAPGSKREMLMKKSFSFPGISPKVEFSSTSVIEECNLKASQSTSPHGASPSRPHHVKTTPRITKSSTVPPHGYLMPTAASKGRSPSPYTHRRMCQLSDEAGQRLQHLQLGPYTFKKETAPQPPFVVPHSPNTSLIECTTSPSACLSSPKKSSLKKASVSFTADLTDPELYGSFRSKPPRAQGHSSAVHHASPETVSTHLPRTPPHRRAPADHSTPLSSSHKDQSPTLARSSLRERFQSPSSSSQWEKIHSRVERILCKQTARCRLKFEEEGKGGGSTQIVTKNPGPSSDEPQTQPDRVIPGEPSVHLDNGTFWTNKAASYTGKSHREVFEDSLGKIYNNLYRKASGHNDLQSQWT